METWGVLVTNSTQKCVHDPHPTISNEETFIQDFVVILKRMPLQYYIHSDMFSMFNSSTTQ